MTPPEPPDELYGIAFATTDAGYDFAGCFTPNDIIAYPSKAEAERDIDRDKPEGREISVLIGVHPRYRDAIDRIAALLELLREPPYDDLRNDWALGNVREIVAEAKACGKSNQETNE